MQKLRLLILVLFIYLFDLKALVVLADPALARVIMSSKGVKKAIERQVLSIGRQKAPGKTTLESVMAFGNDSDEGFASGTIVKTPDGDRRIESLRPGDSIFSFDFKSRKPVCDFIVCIQKKLKKYNTIAVLDNQAKHTEVITCSSLQRFFCMRTMDFQEYWKQSNLIWTEDCRPQIDATFFLADFYRKLFSPRYHKELLLSYSFEEIDSSPDHQKWYARPKILITRLLKRDCPDQEVEVYTLTVANNDNLFVTRKGILVHNTTPPFVVGIGVASEGVGIFDAACNMATGVIEILKTGSIASSGLRLCGWVGIGAFCAYAAYQSYKSYEDDKTKDKRMEEAALDPIKRGFDSAIISRTQAQAPDGFTPILRVAEGLATGPIAQVKCSQSVDNNCDCSLGLIGNLPFVSIGSSLDCLQRQEYIDSVKKSEVLESWSASQTFDFDSPLLFYNFAQPNLQEQEEQNAMLTNAATATLIALQAYRKHCDAKIMEARKAEMERSVEVTDQTAAGGQRRHTQEDQLKKDAKKLKKEMAKAASEVEQSKKKREDQKETVVDVEAANRDLEFFDESLDEQYWANWTIEKDMPLGHKVINGRTYTMHALERMAPDRPDVRQELERRAYWEIENKKILFEDNNEKIKHVKKRVQPRHISPRKVEFVIKHAKDGGKPDPRHPGNKNYWYNKIKVVLSDLEHNCGSVVSVFWHSEGF